MVHTHNTTTLIKIQKNPFYVCVCEIHNSYEVQKCLKIMYETIILSYITTVWTLEVKSLKF